MAAPNRSIYLATPCYGGLAYVDYMRGVLALGPQCAARGVRLQLQIGAGEALIGRGRATVMARFLATDASHLLFVDADIGFEPEAAFRLLDSGHDVVGGIYPRKGPRTGDELDELADGTSQQSAGFRTVASLGAGFLLISRAAAVRMTEGYPQLRARLGDLKGAGVTEAAMVFDSFIDPETRRYLNDYQAFCRRWRDLGGLLWADTQGRLTHVGALAEPPADDVPRLDVPAAKTLSSEAEDRLG